MLEIIKKTNFNFVGGIFPAAIFSGLLTLLVLVYLIVKGPNYGVDFRGGAEVQIKFQKEVSLEKLRSELENLGHGSATVQTIGEKSQYEFLIKVASAEGKLNEVASAMGAGLSKVFSSEGIEIRKTDIVGPKAGAELRTSGFKALLYSLLAIAVYVGLRFDFKYAPGALVSLLHDAFIVFGIILFTGIEFSLQMVAAILTIIGYSINDTVVIYDRIREHEEMSPGTPLKDLVNISLNETLSRTILTAGATLIVSFIMFIFGGPVIKDFFFVLSCGIVFGCYSSLFVAAPMTLLFDKKRAHDREQ
jgi:preprotein translocase subunit SecF